VGTDCSIGKMYTTLAMEREMHARGLKATFRATGQTGILITGGGVPLDAVIADFMAGAIEYLTPDNDPDHWDLIEGQGSLFHISYSGVTLALIHGGQPDALVLCHEPTRTHLRGLPGYGMSSLEELRDLSLRMARIANPACEVTGISINTKAMPEDEARSTTSPRRRRAWACPRPTRSAMARGSSSTRWRGSDDRRPSRRRASASPRSSPSRAGRGRRRRC
jgi:uncharacterized NAD-dependent epimerase/dehydratase family protein